MEKEQTVVIWPEHLKQYRMSQETIDGMVAKGFKPTEGWLLGQAKKDYYNHCKKNGITYVPEPKTEQKKAQQGKSKSATKSEFQDEVSRATRGLVSKMLRKFNEIIDDCNDPAKLASAINTLKNIHDGSSSSNAITAAGDMENLQAIEAERLDKQSLIGLTEEAGVTNLAELGRTLKQKKS